MGKKHACLLNEDYGWALLISYNYKEPCLSGEEYSHPAFGRDWLRLAEIVQLPNLSEERRRRLDELMADMAASDELANTPKPSFSFDVGTPPGGRAPAVMFRLNRAF